MNSLANNPISLSDCGQYFTYCTLDGQLKVWDTLSGHLRQEYTPSSHLSATCVTISWPDRHPPVLDDNAEPEVLSPRKKRRTSTTTIDVIDSTNSTSDVTQAVQDLQLLALGTVNGNILLYSVVKSDLHSQLTADGHEDRVNDISWLTTNDSLFSCSNDKQVIEWCISTSKVKKKWMPDKKAVTAICAVDSVNVLIAGNSIKWLDWEQKTILRIFTGHSSEVQRLVYVKLADSNDIIGSYFMSSAVGDRLVNAWQLKAETKTRQRAATNSLASFSLDDEPISVDVSSVRPNHPILVTIVTRSGLLYIFEHILNGHRKTPIVAKVKIQIMTPVVENVKKSVSKQLNILSAQVCNDRQILLIYGSLLTPIFERISYENCDKNTVLVRKGSYDAIKPTLMVDSGFTKIKSPLKPKNATVVGPAGMAPTRQSVTINNTNNNNSDHSVTVDVISSAADNSSSNRPKKESKMQSKPQNELSMTFEERLRITNQSSSAAADQTTSDAQQQPSSDSLTHVLVQGLQSNDKRMLETVFMNTDEKLIRNTIKKLPIDCISSFLYELQRSLFNKSDQTMVYLKWLEQLLQLRLTFLMSLPNIEEEFGPLLELMNARTHILDRIYRLKGRLNLMISQIRAQNSTDYISRQKARIDYESSSSESSEDEDEDMIDDDMKDLVESNDSDADEADGHKSSGDESIAGEDMFGDNLMSDDEDDDEETYDSNNVNDLETE